MSKKAADLLAALTLEEKALLCTGATPWLTVTVERLGLNSITVTDGPHGLRRLVDIERMRSESYPATCFPVAAALSASWNVDLLHEMGQRWVLMPSNSSRMYR
ncbi:MAG: hypothetical protein F9K27_14415 [Anaerolineae bacterium]|nr:MAG: hypothetical protein F9K27_14415 [Anaerolineae bacterium]